MLCFKQTLCTNYQRIDSVGQDNKSKMILLCKWNNMTSSLEKKKKKKNKKKKKKKKRKKKKKKNTHMTTCKVMDFMISVTPW